MQLSNLLVSREESRNLTGNLCTKYDMETFGRDVFATATDTGAILPPGRLQPALIVRECNLGRDGLFGTSAYLSKADIRDPGVRRSLNVRFRPLAVICMRLHLNR